MLSRFLLIPGRYRRPCHYMMDMLRRLMSCRIIIMLTMAD